MTESLFDMLERMESMVPEYSYTTIEKMVETDRKIREFMIGQMKEVKDMMFHVVQVSYELQKDRLSEEAEAAWDNVTALMTMVQSTKACDMKDKKGCEVCRKNVEDSLYELIRKDRHLVLSVLGMKKQTGTLYRALLDKGREKYFIKNLGKINNCVDEVRTLLAERDAAIKGA